MIRLIEAKSYRCLRYVSRFVNPFDIFVGPNASWKSSFLDVVRFLGDIVSKGYEAAINERTSKLRDLIWQREDENFELAVEEKD